MAEVRGAASAGAGGGARGLIDLVPRTREAPQRVKAGTQDNRVHNRSLVLATLYHDGAQTRPELGKATGLTAPTVSALVADLVAEGLVAETGPRAGARVGKPSNLLKLDDAGAYVVALDLSGAESFHGALLDLRGTVVHRDSLPIVDTLGGAAYELVLQLARRLADAVPRRVLGVGVGSPGIVDDRGVVRHAAHLEWFDRPMAEDLTALLGAPAYVGNDVNAAALAVLHFRGTRARNLMIVTTEHGVGAGLVVAGELVEGEQFAAGEIGHVTVDSSGEPCVCGRRGCLDPLIDAANLSRRVAGLPEAARAAELARAGQALGSVLAPIVCALNLNEVIVTGPPELVDGAFLDSVGATLGERTLAPFSAALRLRSLAGDRDLVVAGAASLVLAGELGVF